MNYQEVKNKAEAMARNAFSSFVRRDEITMLENNISAEIINEFMMYEEYIRKLEYQLEDKTEVFQCRKCGHIDTQEIL